MNLDDITWSFHPFPHDDTLSNIAAPPVCHLLDQPAARYYDVHGNADDSTFPFYRNIDVLISQYKSNPYLYVDPNDWEKYLMPSKIKCPVAKQVCAVKEESSPSSDEGYSSKTPSVERDLQTSVSPLHNQHEQLQAVDPPVPPCNPPVPTCSKATRRKVVPKPKSATKKQINTPKAKKVGRPPGDNPSAGTLKTRRNRKKFKEFDENALQHGAPVVAHALTCGWRPPADFELAFKRLKSQSQWSYSGTVKFCDFLPPTKKRGPIRRKPVSLKELRLNEQKKDGMVYKLVLESLTYLQKNFKPEEYTEVVGSLPKRMYKLV